MEWERMGLDFSLAVYGILAIVFLIAVEAVLVAYLRNAIRKWEQEKTSGPFLYSDALASEDHGPFLTKDGPKKQEGPSQREKVITGSALAKLRTPSAA